MVIDTRKKRNEKRADVLGGLQKAMLVKEAVTSVRLDGETQTLECEHEPINEHMTFDKMFFRCRKCGNNVHTYSLGWNSALDAVEKAVENRPYSLNKYSRERLRDMVLELRKK